MPDRFFRRGLKNEEERRLNDIIVQSLLIGILLVSVAVGATLAAEGLPSSWKSSLEPPPNQAQQFNSTSLAVELGQILSFINTNQFPNASLAVSSLSFVNYPPTLRGIVGQADSQLEDLVTSLPLAGLYLSNAVDLVSLGLLNNATESARIGCAEAILANTSVYDFENITTPQLSVQGVPTNLYSPTLLQLAEKVLPLPRQCTVLSRELQSAFQSNGREDCIKLSGDNFCLALFSPEKSVEIGGKLIVQGSLLKNSSGVSGDTISFYLNGTYLSSTTTSSNGSYYSNFSAPFTYASNASIWAVASENQSLGLSIAIGSNVIFIHLLFNSTRIVLDSGASFFRAEANVFSAPQNCSGQSFIKSDQPYCNVRKSMFF